MRASSAAFAEAVRSSHEPIVRIEVLENGIPTGHVLTGDDGVIVAGTVTLDGGAAIRGRLRLSVVDETLALIPTDPRSLLAPYGNELFVQRGVRLPDGTEELIDLGIFRIVRVRPGGQHPRVEITAIDRAWRVERARYEAELATIPPGQNFAAMIRAQIDAVYPSLEFQFETTDYMTPLLQIPRWSERWSKVCVPYADAIGMELFFDGAGRCVLRSIPEPDLQPAFSLVEGEDSTFTDMAKDWNGEEPVNKVIVVGENATLAAPVSGEAFDDDPLSPTYYFGQFGQHPYGFSSPLFTSSPQCANTARATLLRKIGTQEQVAFTGVPDPRIEPGDTFLATRAAVGVLGEIHVLDSVTIPLTERDLMSGQSRIRQVLQ